MQKARAELGDDARLVSARRVSGAGLPPVYEVRVIGAAPTEKQIADDSLADLRDEIRELRRTITSLTPSAQIVAPTPIPTPSVVAVPEEAVPAQMSQEPAAMSVEDARPLASEPADTPPVPAGSPAPEAAVEETSPGGPLAPWHDVLIRRGLSERSTTAIVARATQHLDNRLYTEPREAIRAALSEVFGPNRRRDRLGDRSTLFVGPAGAGKTTTLAKVAAELVARGSRPVLVCADGESLSGEENLQAVATALGVPFESAFLDGQLETLVEERGEDRIYLVDTPGCSPTDPSALDSVRGLARSLPDPEVLLILPASADADEARLCLDGFAPLGVERVVLTKLDELALPARVIDLAAALPRQICRVTYGRSARGTSAHPGEDAVIARILGTDLAVSTTA